jgi:hypothetical protein
MPVHRETLEEEATHVTDEARIPLVAGLGIDTYLIARLILIDEEVAMLVAGGVSMTLLCLWYGLPALGRLRQRTGRRQGGH